MRNTLAGDSLDTPDELAQKGILPNEELSMNLEQQHNGSITLTRGLSANGEGVKIDAIDQDRPEAAFEVPRELASAIDRLDAPQIKKSVELMGQCVQIQKSAHGVLKHAIETQEALKAAIVEKVRQMGLPVSDTPGTVPDGAAPAIGQPTAVPLPLKTAIYGDGRVCPDSSKSPSLASSKEGGTNNGVITLSSSGSDRFSARTSLPKVDSNPSTSKRPTGTETYARVARMLQESARNRQLSLISRRTPLPGSANLFSFVPAATPSETLAQSPVASEPASVTLSSSPGPEARPTQVSAGATTTTGATTAASTAAVTSAATAAAAAATATAATSAATLAAAATTAAATATAHSTAPATTTGLSTAPPTTSALERAPSPGIGLDTIPGGVNGASAGLGLGFGSGLGLGNLWETFASDGAEGLGMNEAVKDEETLRMEMKTSMDMHRLMRSRQKNQLKLHTQLRQEGGIGEDGVAEGTDGAASGDNRTLASSGLQEAGFLGGAAAEDSSVPASPPSGAAGNGPVCAEGNMARPSGVTAVRRIGDTPLPAPPPDDATALPDSGGSSRNSAVKEDRHASPKSDAQSPPLLNADWNWDEEALDSQLFSFLLDS